MFKNMLKRSWLSTIRKPSRTIIVGLILFVMANMLLATVAIQNSVKQSTEYAKEKLGGTVSLTADATKMRNNMEAARKSGQTGTAVATIPKISEDLAKKVAQSQYLKDFTYSITTSANADSYKVVQTAQNEREQQFKGALDDAAKQTKGQTRNFNNPMMNQGDTSIQGINSYNFIGEVGAGNMSIVDGDAFNESTTDGAIISQDLANANSLKVGDPISFKTTGDSPKEISLKVTGIYVVTSDNFNNNAIYTNIETAKKFLTDDQLKNLNVNNVQYFLNSANDKDAFLKESAAKYPEIAQNNLTLDVDDSNYQTMVGPIENVGSFATTVFWIVVVAAVVIITLIVVINVKDRRYEMGVLLSLGSKKIYIIGQVFIELAIVGAVAFLASFGTSQIVAQKMGEEMLSQQVTESNKTAQNPATSGRGMMPRGQQASRKTTEIEKINVSAGPSEYLTLVGFGYLILIIAMILPSINILRYQPKTILTGKE
jgi:putative ABC transport system permease protein